MKPIVAITTDGTRVASAFVVRIFVAKKSVGPDAAPMGVPGARVDIALWGGRRTQSAVRVCAMAEIAIGPVRERR